MCDEGASPTASLAIAENEEYQIWDDGGTDESVEQGLADMTNSSESDGGPSTSSGERGESRPVIGRCEPDGPIWEDVGSDASDGGQSGGDKSHSSGDDGKGSASSQDEFGKTNGKGSGSSQDGKSGTSSQDEGRSLSSNGHWSGGGSTRSTTTRSTAATGSTSDGSAPQVVLTAQHPHLSPSSAENARDACTASELQFEQRLAEQLDSHLSEMRQQKNKQVQPEQAPSRKLRFGRAPPHWSLPMDPLSAAELRYLAEAQSSGGDVTVMLTPAFPLRGPKDVADLCVAAGFVFDSTAPHGLLCARLPRYEHANRSLGQAYVQCRSLAVAELLVQHLFGATLQFANDPKARTYSVIPAIVASRTNTTHPKSKLKVEWKAIVAPSELLQRQCQITYEDACAAQADEEREAFWRGSISGFANR